MRHLVQVLAATVAFLLLAYAASAYVLPPPGDVAWIEAIVARKEQRIASMPEGRRIVILGGSEAHYSISAEQIERETGIPTVNFGTHAGMGIGGHIGLVEPHLRPGDIVIYSANYYAFNMPNPTDLRVGYMRRNRPLYFLTQPVGTWPAYFGANVADQSLRALPAKRFREAAAIKGQNVTAYGDQGPAEYRPVTDRVDYVPDFAEPPTSFQELADFQMRWPRVTFYLYWMAVADHPVFHAPESRKLIDRFPAMARVHGLRMLNKPYQTLLAADELADGPTHGNAKGRERHTTILIRRLKTLL